MSRKPRQLKSPELQHQIVKLLSKDPKKRFDAVQISRKLNLSNPISSIEKECLSLVTRGLLEHAKNGTYIFPSLKKHSTGTIKTYQGYVDMTRSGSAYITGTDAKDDIYVAAKSLMGALHKDVVKVQILPQGRNRRLEGKVVDIVERSISHVIGTLQVFMRFGVVQVEQPKQFPDVFIKLEEINEDMHGAIVKVHITDWGKGQNKSIWGKIQQILDAGDQNEISMQNILLTNGFNIDFPDNVLAEARELHKKINESETAKRRDFRNKVCFTIDPLTAKDFDDALSVEKLENGHYEIGVHIADVTHFLEENTELDKEAFSRSTSVYIADRVCPMLPEELSNHLCSLVPNEDRYTFSAVFDMDIQGKIYAEWYGKTIIHSCRRFTYEEAQERIETGEGDYVGEINILQSIAKKLREKRFQQGSINFETDEIQFTFDDKMVPTGIKIRERKDAHMLVEDFMLLANKKVAEYVFKKTVPPVPFVYRIHDLPNPDKLEDFVLFAKELGFQFHTKTPGGITESFNRLADDIKKNETLKLLEPLAIRTMSKAEYSPHNIGHYGLGFHYYTHFTSPIRRYADVLVHRLLFKNLTGEFRADISVLEKQTKHISLQERKAMDAERESVKYKLAEYMAFFVGNEFDGIISGMIEKGVFIEITDTKAEGFIAFSDMDSSYVVAENKYKAFAKRGGEDLFVGKKVRVKVLSSDKETLRIDLKML